MIATGLMPMAEGPTRQALLSRRRCNYGILDVAGVVLTARDVRRSRSLRLPLFQPASCRESRRSRVRVV